MEGSEEEVEWSRDKTEGGIVKAFVSLDYTKTLQLAR